MPHDKTLLALCLGSALLGLGMLACGGSSRASGGTVNPSNPVPGLISFSPATAKASSGDFDLTLYGADFVPGSTVMWNGNAHPTTFVSSSQLTAEISSSDVASPGIAQVTVSNGPPGGGTSHVFRFDVESAVAGQRFLYVANSGENTISAYSIDPNIGSLNELMGSPFVSVQTGPMRVG